MRTQACRGAIRFNESLNYQDCSELIKTLTNCKCRFRCAHGRISVKPLLYLHNDNHKEQTILEQNLYQIFFQNFPNIQIKLERKQSKLNGQN